MFEFNNWIFLKYLNLAKTLLLGLEEIEEGIIEMSICLPFVGFRISIDFIGFLLNWNKTYCLKDISLSLTVNLSHPNSYIAVINFQAVSPNSAIWEIFLAVLLPNGHCLMNTAILRREHMLFFVLPAKYLSTLLWQLLDTKFNNHTNK